MTVAALYVAPGGAYYGMPDVEPWGLPEKDARDYPGPWPVVAHPPCNRWSKLAYIHQAAGRSVVGDDAGCFAAALSAVRTWGGVLEHPEASAAWAAFALPRPTRVWHQSICGGWVAAVDQLAYGHEARKRTWLYAVKCPLPTLATSNETPVRSVEWQTRGARMATPIPFRDLLLDMARGVRRAA